MPDRRTDDPGELVPHPRFGDRSVPSGFEVPGEVIRESYPYDNPSNLFLESAIPADVSRQKYTVRPLVCYVDLLRRCVECRRQFIFFAREQKFWYEVVRFWIDAQCLRCPECRREKQQRRNRRRRFARFMGKATLGDDELATLAEDAVFFYRAGALRNEQKLRRIKNLVTSRLPESEASRAILALIAEIEQGPVRVPRSRCDGSKRRGACSVVEDYSRTGGRLSYGVRRLGATVEEHTSPDRRLRFLVITEREGAQTLGFDGYPWHTHGDLLASLSGLPEAEAVHRFVADLLADRSVIAVCQGAAKVRDVWISEDSAHEAGCAGEEETIEHRRWSGSAESDPRSNRAE